MDNTKDRFGGLKTNSSAFRFPAAFPYDYGSSALSSPVHSLVGSAETESSDEEDFLLTGLTRQLTLRDAPKFVPAHQSHEVPAYFIYLLLVPEISLSIFFPFLKSPGTYFCVVLTQKAKMVSGSPQSTLTKVGSWSGRSTMSSNGSPNGPSQVSSPPTTPLAVENDPWELIYQAAGQIARLKMSGADGFNSNPGILGPPKRLSTPPPLKNSSPACFYNSQVSFSCSTFPFRLYFDLL